MNALDAVGERITQLLGSPPANTKKLRTGYSSAERWLIETASGQRAFAKIGATPRTRKWLRDEAEVYRNLRGSFMPKLLAWHDDALFPLLVLEDLSEGAWPPPWTEGQIHEVVKTISELHSSVAALRPFSEVAGDYWRGWKDVAEDPLPFLSLRIASENWLLRALPHLVEQEGAVKTEGTAVTHFDLRSDNICICTDGVRFVDWNFACLGNPLLDLGFMLPSLRTEGGPRPETLLPNAGDIAAYVSGFFAAQAGLAAEDANMSRIRGVQLSQLNAALPWVIRELDLPPLDS